jgi:hypothetical protein
VKLRFKRHPDNTTSAQSCANTVSQVTYTYLALQPIMHEVRTFVIARAASKAGPPTIAEMRNHFSDTELMHDADEKDWEEWIDVFSQPRPPQACTAALMFLQKKTGRTWKTLKTYFSEHKRSNRQRN